MLSQGVCLLNQQTDGSRQDTSTRRHLFVINARMETLRYDAAVIPTDARFHVEAHWEPLLGSSGSTLRSAGWGSQRFGRASDGRAVWFVSVGRDHGEDVEWGDPLADTDGRAEGSVSSFQVVILIEYDWTCGYEGPGRHPEVASGSGEPSSW